jgi:DNA polymerase II large subunit
MGEYLEIEEYFDLFTKKYDEACAIANSARALGYDPETFVEIKSAPDLASRIEGIIGVEGLADIIKSKGTKKSRTELAFEMVKEICTNSRFEMQMLKRLTLGVRVGLAILTEGVLVAPTEGVQGIELHKNADGSDYVSVLYAGPIRGAGGTSAALSVALADYGRRIFGIGAYKATSLEVERYIEEMLLYHSRKARLQYLPPTEHMKIIIENCPVCVDGIPSEDIEVSTHRNIKRLDGTGKEQMLTNRIRGGIGLVICEGIAQKAKSVLKHTKSAGIDWSWLNQIIKIDKPTSDPGGAREDKNVAVFLQELVAGRPIFAYPEYPGSFRLRYGRSRMTGIAAKGFSPATMHLLHDFIAVGTQVKVERPGKGCIATPVDSIEGPFVKLSTGEAYRVNNIEQARAISGEITKILSVGDILVTYGDFKKANAPLAPTSYVEEFWEGELRAAGFDGRIDGTPQFRESWNFSKTYGVPMHPRYIYDYSDISKADLVLLSDALQGSKIEGDRGSIFNVASVEIALGNPHLRNIIERLCIPHMDDGSSISINTDDAQSLLASFGFVREESLHMKREARLDGTGDVLGTLNSLAPFRIMRRSTRVGARMGRPEKARERLMKPAPHMLFPIGEYGGKERNFYKAYVEDKRRFEEGTREITIARYRCIAGKEYLYTAYCNVHKSRAEIERKCLACGLASHDDICAKCGSKTIGYEVQKISLIEGMASAMENIKMQIPPKVVKGVKGLVSNDKVAERLEKGLLRAVFGVSIFKDGTARFDATDTPMTHFYPQEIGVSPEKLVQLGYTTDADGKPLERPDQLVELMPQDVILNRRGADYFTKVAKFVDELLVRFYKMKPFYSIKDEGDIVGQYVVTLAPHISCGILGRIIGFTNANVGFAHPYTIAGRRRNCDGDEDTTMLLLDALVNFSRHYLPVTIGGTMDAPLILSVHVLPEEIDDEVHAMEVVESYGVDFYRKTLEGVSPAEVQVELVANRLGKKSVYSNLRFTHRAGPTAVADSPTRSTYTRLKTMAEKIEAQFQLMDVLYTIDRPDTAKRLILSHFIPDLMGNLHSFSKQTFRCTSCNSKYRRVPLIGKCRRCDGHLTLTISKGGIEKYLSTAVDLADRYSLEPNIKQRIKLLKNEIEVVFGGIGTGNKSTRQFNLANFM